MVELTYKFDEKSSKSVSKGKSTAKVPFKPFFFWLFFFFFGGGGGGGVGVTYI